MKISAQAFFAAMPFVLCLACDPGQRQDSSYQIDSLSSPAAQGSAEPYLFTDGNGTVYLSWVEKADSGHRFVFSTLAGNNWAEPMPIAADTSWFVNWADYPMMTSDGAGHLLAHVLSKSGDATFAYDVKLFASADQGRSWQAPILLNDDGVQGEHGFVSMIPQGDHYLVAWLDGRNASSEGHEQHEGHHGAMSLRAARVAYDGTKTEEWELDDRTCDCCQTAAVNTASGPVVIYRDRSSDEVRDMSIVRFVDGSWTAPATVHNDSWKIAGCPVNGPRADAIGNTLAVAWFTAANDQSVVNVCFSADGGASFDDPVRVDMGKPIGRVDLVLVNDQVAWVSWMEGPDIMIRSVGRDGTRGEPAVVSASSEARSSGFPQIVLADNAIILAWTDDQVGRIRTARLNL